MKNACGKGEGCFQTLLHDRDMMQAAKGHRGARRRQETKGISRSRGRYLLRGERQRYKTRTQFQYGRPLVTVFSSGSGTLSWITSWCLIAWCFVNLQQSTGMMVTYLQVLRKVCEHQKINGAIFPLVYVLEGWTSLCFCF